QSRWKFRRICMIGHGGVLLLPSCDLASHICDPNFLPGQLLDAENRILGKAWLCFSQGLCATKGCELELHVGNSMLGEPMFVTGQVRAVPFRSVAPLLRWAGSKKRQFEELRRLFPVSFNSYAEPFAGSAAFLFRLRPTTSKLNDVNQDLCDFYRWAQREP